MYKVLFDPETAQQVAVQQAVIQQADAMSVAITNAFLRGKGVAVNGGQILPDCSGVIFPHLNEDGTPKKSKPEKESAASKPKGLGNA